MDIHKWRHTTKGAGLVLVWLLDRNEFSLYRGSNLCDLIFEFLIITVPNFLINCICHLFPNLEAGRSCLFFNISINNEFWPWNNSNSLWNKGEKLIEICTKIGHTLGVILIILLCPASSDTSEPNYKENKLYLFQLGTSLQWGSEYSTFK